MSDSTDRWVPDLQNPDLFDRVIPESRWAGYAIHRLEFFSERARWEPKDESPQAALEVLLTP